MNSQDTIWILDDVKSIRWVLEKSLNKAGLNTLTFQNGDDLLHRLAQETPDAIISDIRMPGISGLDLLSTIQETHPQLPVIIMTAHSDLDSAVSSYSRGAFEYLPKPFDIEEAVAMTQRALAHAREQGVESGIETEVEPSQEIIGEAPAMQEVFRAIGRLSQSNISVLINGDSGTGKELVARALHDYGKRKGGSFVAINMAAIPRELIESELFGHEKGAFTGAQTRVVGRFEQAAGGTLFLDEIGDMPTDAQTRLLRVLQEGEFTTVGGRTPIKSNVRIIAATHHDLKQLIRNGTFREDLFYRLNVVPIRLPPLRERTEDIPELVRVFLARAAEEGLSWKIIDNDAMDRLKNHSWPGNVRELENLIKRLAALYSHEVISFEDIDGELSEAAPEPADDDEKGLSKTVEQHLATYFSAHAGGLPAAGLYQRVLREVERPLITLTLQATKGNQIRAAEVLGLNRNTLRKKIRELNIPVIRGAK